MEAFELRPIARVRSPRREPVDDDWGAIESVVELDERFEATALSGLDAFTPAELGRRADGALLLKTAL